MTPEELYERYKGRMGCYSYLDKNEQPSRGIIIGYTHEDFREETPLIMKVTNGGYGWETIDSMDFIFDISDGTYYQYCSPSSIFKFGR